MYVSFYNLSKTVDNFHRADNDLCLTRMGTTCTWTDILAALTIACQLAIQSKTVAPSLNRCLTVTLDAGATRQWPALRGKKMMMIDAISDPRATVYCMAPYLADQHYGTVLTKPRPALALRPQHT